MPDHWTTADIPDQTGRVGLVTGANSGLGFHQMVELARRGAQVLLGARSRERGEAALARARAAVPAGRVELLSIDLADLDAVRRAADQVLVRGAGLDLLINNAGVMAVPRRQTTAQGFELQLGTNHLGHFALTGLLLEALLERAGSRVVTVTSFAQRAGRFDFDDLQWERGYRPWPAYSRAKLANALFTVELDRRLRRAGASTISVGAHPGYTRTGLQYSGPRLGGGSRSATVLGLATRVLAQPSERGALPVLRAATDPEAAGGDCYGPDGLGELRGFPRKVRFGRAAYDPRLGAELWAASEELTGVGFGALLSG